MSTTNLAREIDRQEVDRDRRCLFGSTAMTIAVAQR